MDAEIRREDGLLRLIGFFWLEKGLSTVGSSQDCRIRLPKPAPRLLGAFDFDGTRLTFGADFGQHVEIDGRAVDSTSPQLIQGAGSLGRIRCGELIMGIVREPESLGIQVWNITQNSRLSTAQLVRDK